jgi:hypothetical protein
VQNGDVTLTGTVDSRDQKRMAEDIVERCSGVNEVHNQLRVQPSNRFGNQQGSTITATAGGSSQGGTERGGQRGTTRSGATSGS